MMMTLLELFKRKRRKQFCSFLVVVFMLIALQFQQFIRIANDNLINSNNDNVVVLDVPSTTTTTIITKLPSKNIENPIFYNVYLPLELPDDVKRVRIFGEDEWNNNWDETKKRYEFTNHLENIIQEQIIELQQQFTDSNTKKPPPLLYTQIGNSTIPVALQQRKDNNNNNNNSNSINNQTLSSYCWNSDRCYQMKQIKDGNEVDTLQQLWDYCQLHPTNVVGYIHNKGSYHASFINQKQRRITTKSTLECYKYLLALNKTSNNNQRCNVCTGHFQVSPQFLSLANMWSTSCTYVNQLIEPVVFEQELSRFHQQLFLMNNKTKYRCFQPSSSNNKPNVLGKGRYAFERWIFSHPNLQPCYNIPIPWNQLPDRWPVQFKVLKPPKIGSIKPVGFYLKHSNNFGRLDGRLLEYKYLYNDLPPKDSWIWTYYKSKFRQGNELIKCLEDEDNHSNNSSAACTMLPTTKRQPSINDDDGHSQEKQQQQRPTYYYYPICNVSKGILG